MKLWIKFRRTVIEILRQKLLEKRTKSFQPFFPTGNNTGCLHFWFTLAVDALHRLILLKHFRKKNLIHYTPNRILILIINVVQSIWNCNCSSRLSLQRSTITMVTAGSGNQTFCTLFAGFFLNTASCGIMLAFVLQEQVVPLSLPKCNLN